MGSISTLTLSWRIPCHSYRNQSIDLQSNSMNLVTDSCRDGWNVRNCSSSHIQVFRDRWSVQIWQFIAKFEYEYSRICVVSVAGAETLCQWWNSRWCCCFGCSDCVCLFGCLVCMIRKIGLYTLSLRYEREYS